MSLKKLVDRVLGRDPNVKVQVADVPCELLGTEYGGHTLATKGLHTGSVVYSFGVGEDVSFDLALIKRFGSTVHAFDPTPRSIAWVNAQLLPEQFVMHGYGIADKNGTLRFSPPTNPTHISHTLLERPETAGAAIEVQVKRLGTIMAELGHQRLDVLKMDVEGAEYDVLADVLAQSIEIDQILVEFHHQFKNVGAQKTRDAVTRLNNAGYRVFAVSPSGHEVSFIRS